MKPELVAPCGMNCNVCSAYLAFSTGIPKERGKINHCEGCLPRSKNCAFLKKHCRKIGEGKLRFCFECSTFPCERLEKIDARYKMRYDTSFIENLKEIKKKGIDGFLKAQDKRFQCGKCGGTISVHNRKCYGCEDIKSWKG